MSCSEDVMVLVNNAYKKLGSQQVLLGLKMNVKKRQIYALLGPSGCGKTVLLNCILGMRPLDSGEIALAVSKRKHVGYMPQEVALFKEFTIKEIFIFYGRLFGINRSKIDKCYENYVHVLGLPNWNANIISLSGGEQRRVSFAVTLLHDPQLLILDEPTVGVDTILSQRIWKYLQELATAGKTIIITTHYVEEARHAHTIGMMRTGVILCEDTPDEVMNSQNVSTLEDAFLSLSKRQDNLHPSDSDLTRANSVVLKTKTNGAAAPLQSEEIFNVDRFNAQLKKNILWMKRNTWIMAFLLLLPATQSLFYCISFGQNPQHLKMIMHSEELLPINGYEQCSNINYYDNENKRIDLYDCSLQLPLSCHLAHYLNKSMDIRFVNNLESAQTDVRKNRAWGFIHVRPNFSTSLIQRVNDITLDENDTIDSSTAYITMDMTNYIIANYLRKQIIDRYNEFKAELMKRCNIDKRIGELPLKFENPIYGNNNPVYAHSGLPGFFCSFCFYFTMIFTSGGIMMEKIIGLLERSMVAGMTYYEVVGAHVVVQFALITVQKAIMFIVFYVCFDNPFIGSTMLAIMLLYCIDAVGVAYGFMLTEVFASDRLVSYGGIGATLAVFSLGGIIWPLEGAHVIIKSLLWAFPVTPAVESYKMITCKGFTVTHPIVYYGFISCIVWTLLLTAISVYLGKLKKIK